MTAIVQIPALPATLDGPRVPGVAIRPAVALDVPFLDLIQRQYRHAVDRVTRKQFWEYAAAGQVLVAEGATPYSPLGYVIAANEYLKRDDLGVIHQLCVAPGARRKLIGASLLKAALSLADDACRLVCCWCPQDVPDAGAFWEAMGFVPLAFRAEAEDERRVHVFWQRRVIAGDESTPWWYPAQSTAGIIRPERIVFPIPPGVHWKDVRPIPLPEKPIEQRVATLVKPATRRGHARRDVTFGPPPGTVGVLVGGRIKYVPRRQPLRGLWFAPPAAAAPSPAVPVIPPTPPKRVAPNIHVKHLERARELRDHWLDDVNGKGWVFEDVAKYEVARDRPGFEGGSGAPSATCRSRRAGPRMTA